MSAVRTGLERIASQDPAVLSLVRGRRIGLLAHLASVTRSLVHAADVLEAAGARIAAYFGPEHGYGGEAQDMIGVEGARTAAGVPIHSLYGATYDSLSPRREHLEGLDALVIDLMDVGSRYYTFVWTAALAVEAAAAAGVQSIVLDRPNPLGGVRMEGAPQRPGLRSFVGLYEIPVRHGMTIGEVVTMAAHRASIAGLERGALEVVRMEGWDPERGWDATGLPWVAPSPNMPTLEVARVYPGGCLLEGTNLSEGRGTTRPFEVFGAPFVDGKRLAREVAIEGAVLRPLTFSPMFHKHARTVCGGCQLHVVDPERFEPFRAYLEILAAIRASTGAMAWRTEPYELVDDVLAIDLLTGDPRLREAIDEGRDLRELHEEGAREVAKFGQERRRWLLYPRGR